MRRRWPREPLVEIRHDPDAENIKDVTCTFADRVPRITSFAPLRVVHGVKRRFLSQYADHVGARAHVEATARKYARHHPGQLLMQDALARRDVRAVLRLLREVADIEPTVVISRWSVLPVIAAVLGPRRLDLAGRLRRRPLSNPGHV